MIDLAGWVGTAIFRSLHHLLELSCPVLKADLDLALGKIQLIDQC